jgi:predicted nucleic acid-binding protein
MEQQGEAYESLNEIKRRFESKYPEFDSSWKQMIKTAGIGLVNEMKDKLKIEYQFLKQLTDFKFRIIVDNNFVFGQIKGLLKKKGQIEDSFLFKLLLSKSVQMFAPPKLQEELIAKIHSVLKEEDHELALEYASVLTSKLRIQDAEWIDDWKKANQLIGEKDEDDVPYLALAFAVDGHAIISFDKVFQNQGDVKVWEFGEADRIITNYHSGILSFALAGATMNLLVYLISIIGKLIRDIFLDLINLLKQLAKGVITVLSKIPPELLLILTAFGLLAFFTSDELQKKGKDFAITISEMTKKAIAKLREMLKNVGEFLTNLIEFVGPVAIPTLEFLAYLMVQYHEMEKELDLLENKRG